MTALRSRRADPGSKEPAPIRRVTKMAVENCFAARDSKAEAGHNGGCGLPCALRHGRERDGSVVTSACQRRAEHPITTRAGGLPTIPEVPF